MQKVWRVAGGREGWEPSGPLNWSGAMATGWGKYPAEVECEGSGDGYTGVFRYDGW